MIKGTEDGWVELKNLAVATRLAVLTVVDSRCGAAELATPSGLLELRLGGLRAGDRNVAISWLLW